MVDGARIGPPPDMPSLLLNNRIVYLGLPINSQVTELILSELLYLSAMTVSNLVAIACVCAWVRTARWEKWHSSLGPWLGRLGAIYARPAHARALLPAQATPPVSSVAMRGFSLAAIAVLVYHRQKETLRLCRVPVPHWLGRAGPSD